MLHCGASASGNLEQWSAGFAPGQGLALGPHPLVATRSATAMAASERIPGVGEKGGLVDAGTAAATPKFGLRQANLVVSEAQASGRGQDPLPATSLQGQAFEPDDREPDQLPSVPDAFPNARGGRVCTLMVAAALLMAVAINISAWLWNAINCSKAELEKWSAQVAYKRYKRYN